MEARVKKAAGMNCDAVEPDHMSVSVNAVNLGNTPDQLPHPLFMLAARYGTASSVSNTA